MPPMKRARSAPVAAVVEDPEQLKRDIQILEFEKQHIVQKLFLERENVQTQQTQVGKLRADNAELLSRIGIMETGWNQVLQDMNNMIAQCPGGEQSSSEEKGFLEKMLTVENEMDGATRSPEFSKWVQASVTKKKEVTVALLQHFISSTAVKPANVEAGSQLQVLQIGQRKASRELQQAKTQVASLKVDAQKARYEAKEAKLEADMARKQAARHKYEAEQLQKKLADALERSKDHATASGTDNGTVDGKGGDVKAAQMSVDAEKEIESYRAKADELRAEVVTWKTKCIGLEIQPGRLKEEDVKKSDVFKGLEGKYGSLQIEYERTRKEADIAKDELERTRAQLRTDHARFEDLKGSIRGRIQQELDGLVKSQRQEEKDTILDLKAQNEKLQQELEFNKRSNGDLRSEIKRQSEELKKLRTDNMTLKKATNGQMSWLLLIRKLETTRNELEQKLAKFSVDNSSSSNDRASLQAQNSQLQKKIQEYKEQLGDKEGLANELTIQKEIVQELESELDRMGNQFTDIELENQSLKSQIEQGEKMRNSMLEQRLKLEKALRDKNREMNLVRAKTSSQERQIAQKDEAKKKLTELVEKHKKEIHEKDQLAETLKWQQTGLRRHAKEATEELNRIKAERERQKNPLEELKKQVELLEQAKQKLDKENLDLSHKVGKFKKKLDLYQNRKGKSSTVKEEELEAQVRYLQEKLVCSLCSRNEKTAIITRCMHTFCRECINRSLEVRNRKCPTCTKQFSKNDVKDLWM
eukprot:CAMPEP_0114538212 /NCGR_PEP_ID=MMETSP0109-20121206/30010_1 /TAXON_ID=29199 /ORGANISM="Chlorarachnion reptans, Strain CCCM449" /LENGTH=755 /DNA_ID=CAMNT_0001722191 /DNA_START=115 /DNA_END=2382 /DNA_ORIENTATION=-